MAIRVYARKSKAGLGRGRVHGRGKPDPRPGKYDDVQARCADLLPLPARGERDGERGELAGPNVSAAFPVHAPVPVPAPGF